MTAAPEPLPTPAPAVDWRRNLAALWFAEFTAIFGFSFVFPFLPLFMRDLGVHDAAQLALWTGWSAGAGGISQAIFSPLWGAVADRYGRKSMLIRAMVGGGLTVGAISLAQSPIQVVALRVLQGAASGTVAAATAIVATGTPRNRVAWAMGVLTSSIAVGGAVGPIVGGILATLLGARWIFVIGGVILLLSVLPVWFVVREGSTERRREASAPLLSTLRATAPGTVGAVAVLMTAQALMQVSYSAFQPLLVLRLLAVSGAAAATLTGITFGVSGLASAGAAVVYSRFVRRTGYVPVAAAGALLLGVAEAVAGYAGEIYLIVLAGAVAGLFYGCVGPAVSSMIGLETPASAQARVFGLSSSAIAIGFGIGPLAAGQLAAGVGLSTTIAAAAAVAAVLAAVLALRGREPAR